MKMLAIEEWKPQYQKVASWWWRDPNIFEEATHTWSIRKILSLLPPIQTMELPSHRRLKQILPIARAKWQERLRREAELEAIRKLNEAKEAALREGLAVDTGRITPETSVVIASLPPCFPSLMRASPQKLSSPRHCFSHGDPSGAFSSALMRYRQVLASRLR